MFEVQTLMSYGWENVWQEDDKPLTFETESEAQAEIEEMLENARDAHEKGYLDEAYNASDYRIIEI